MTEGQSFDRRKAERFKTFNLLSYYEKTPGGEIISQGIAKTLDISETGALIMRPDPFTYIDNIQFDIALEEEIISTKATIVDQEESPEEGGWLIRVKFKELRPAQWHRIMSFIHTLQ